MREFWRTRFWKMVVLLAFLAGIQPLAAPSTLAASMDMVQQGAKAVASDCGHCDMSGKSASLCHMICTPISATNQGVAAALATPTSLWWPSYQVAFIGRDVRPSLAPPRIF
jgi:hypothetical protein